MIPAECWLGLLCLVFFINTPLLLTAETQVYISSNGANYNCSPPSVPQPCNYSLTYGLTYLSTAQPPLIAYIYPGQYRLEAGIFFKNKDNISLEAHNGWADITCSEGFAGSTGLSFIGSTMIAIRNLFFHSSCGIGHYSTTPSLSDRDTFVQFNATLYFESCFDVTMQSVIVNESLGIGVQFYATTGKVTISDCTIANNPLKSEKGSIGGGLLIEFPFCLPGNVSSCTDTESRVPLESISHSNYVISDCDFTDNRAINAPYKGQFILPYGRRHSAFSYGGGLSVFFKGSSNNNVIQISNCQWLYNQAVYGGGLYIGVQDNSYNNNVTLNGFNVFTGNTADRTGGGAVFAYLFSPKTPLIGSVPNNNKFRVSGTNFTNNTAGSRGGGMFYLTPRQLPNGTAQNLNQLTISDCVWESNKGQLGSGLDLSIFHSVSEGTIHDVVLTNCSFISNVVTSPKKDSASILGSGAMYVDGVPTVFDNIVTFCDNHDETALVVSATMILFNSNTTAIFTNNSGNNGGAIALHLSAFMEINVGTHFLFENNIARNRGGAIYAESFGTSLEQTSLDCMIRYSNMIIHPSQWDTVFNFSNNQANRHSSSIYASTIQPCTLLNGYTDDDGDTNRTRNVFCWNENDNSIWEYDSDRSQRACMEHIQTDIASFDSVSTNITVMPGLSAKLNIKPLNDQGSNISEYIFHVYPSNDDAIKIDEDYYYISQNIVTIYPASNETKRGTIVLEAVQQNIVQFEVNVTFQDCHAGLSLKNDSHNHYKCTCPPNQEFFKCDNLNLTATLLQGYWIGLYDTNNGITTVIGHCISCTRAKSVNMTLDGYLILNAGICDVPKMLCGNNSGGVLCNKCEDGYAPAISYDKFKCVPCNDTVSIAGVSSFIFFSILLPLVYLIIVYIIDVPITSGLFHGPILLCQIVSSIVLLDAGGIIAYDKLFPDHGSGAVKFQRAYTGLYDSFNLYFLRSLLETQCFSKHIRNFATVIAINYIAAFMPLLVVILFALVHYCSLTFCKCCKTIFGTFVMINPQKFPKASRFFDSRWNKANFLATAILLSYTNVAVITSYLTTNVVLEPTEGDKSYNVLYLDGTIDFLSKQHLPYFVCACLFGVTYLVIVPLFLFFYRPNNPKENGGFLNHLLGQFQNEFRSGRKLNPNQNCTYKEPINNKKLKMEIKLQTWHLCQKMCFFFCKCRCSRHLNAFFITRFEHGNYQWFSGVLFLIRLLIVLPFVFAYNAFILLFFQFVICSTYAIAVVLFHPYEKMLQDGRRVKKIDPNIIEASSMMLLSLLIALSMYQYTYTMTGTPLSSWAFILQAILVWIPLVWITIAYCVLFYERHKKTLKKVWAKCCRRCRQKNLSIANVTTNEATSLINSSQRCHGRDRVGSVELINSGSTDVHEDHYYSDTEHSKA